MSTQFNKTPEAYWLDGNFRGRTQIIIERTIDGKQHVPLGIDFDRADFLSAVEKECGVIIIDRADLPEVSLTSDGVPWVGGLSTTSSDLARQRVRAFLALAEYLDPPVDEAQVEALATLIADDGDWEIQDADVIARRLVERGVRVEVES